MRICHKHGYDIQLDTNLKPWVSVTNMGMIYYWIPTSNLSVCHKHWHDILLDISHKPWVSITNMSTTYNWIPTSNCEYLSKTLVWDTIGYQTQTVSICHKHGYNIQLGTNLKPWVCVTNTGTTYYWIPTSNHEYLSQTWVWHTTGYQPQTMSICYKHGYDILLDTYLKPWVSVTNMGMTYCWIPTSNHKYLSQTWVWHNSGYLAQTVSICHKHGYDILLDTNLKPWVSVTNIGTIYYWMPTSDCKYLSQT